MTSAILFRGHAYRDIGVERPWGVDWRKCIESQRKYLIEPLKKRYGGNVYFYLSVHQTALIEEVKNDYRDSGTVIASPGSSQKRVMLSGLDFIDDTQRMRRGATCSNFDLIVTCRFDLELLFNPMEHPNFNPDKVNFLWREWNEASWRDHYRVPDAIHFVPGKFLNGFRKGIEETPSDTCLHLIYRPVSKYVEEENLNILIREGYIDSNTDHCQNPFYKMIRVKE